MGKEHEPVRQDLVHNDGIIFELSASSGVADVKNPHICLLDDGSVSVTTPNYHTIARQPLDVVAEQGYVDSEHVASPKFPVPPHTVQMLQDVVALALRRAS